MSFAGKNLTQGGQMTAYRWRMFLQVNNWIGFWVFVLFFALAAIIFVWRVPQEVMENGAWYWFSDFNSSFIDLMPKGGKQYNIHYYYAPGNVTYTLKMTLAQMHADPYMKVMGERFLTQLQMATLVSSIFSFGVFLAIAVYIARIGRRESEDEYISGMLLTEKPAEVNALLRKNGELSDLRVGDLHMVQRAEVMNFLIHGTIGVGKSTLIRWLLQHIRKRGDRAIIYDSGCTFTETHYNPATDIILNPHDERCANWHLWGECVDAVDFDNMASSLIPVEGDSDPFWVSSSRTIFADLAIRMSADPERSIEKFLKTLLSLDMKSLREYLANTPSANLVEEKIEKTAISIRSVVTNYAKALRYLQGLDDGVKPPFTIREWMTTPAYDNSWLFISTQARHRKSVRPLISLWVSLATLMLQSMGENSDRRVWFIFDEIPSLQRIPEFNETLAEGRKFGGCFVLGVQNMAQLVHVYGRELAKSIFDLLNTRMYGRSPSSEMAKLVEEELGNQRRKEIREQNSYGLDQVRDGISLGKDKVNNPVVDYEQIMQLPNLNFYVRLPGEYPVVRLKLKFRKQAKPNVGLIERNIRDALSPELEKLVLENERASAAAGVNFPTGDESLERRDTTAAESSVTLSSEMLRPATSNEPRSSTGTSSAPLMTTVEKPAPAHQAQTPTAVTQPAHSVWPQQTPPPAKPVSPSRPLTGAARLSASDTASLDALDRLKKSRRRVQTEGSDETDAAATDGGESLNLEMDVAELADGGLQLTTAGTDRTDDDVPEHHRASRRMAQEEENILRHREHDDPGYDADYARHYDDGELER
ncbi:type IV conjugative transfer system coupling protein TraD [Siccibacter turicensis]|uniref:type IV conjugative transfer system coupling protein TraD n=1 Tax=Siccibacter turicensis TaxID=357233 RepID=UPI001020A2D6|nr:type IV conjugative transfer system coupling protein TraD [Siccibacter turicensis]